MSDSEEYQMRLRNQRLHPPRDIEDKHQQMNTLFGIMPFKNNVMERPLEMHSKAVRELYQEKPITDAAMEKPGKCVSLGNWMWVILCGWWMFLVYSLVGVLLTITWIGRDHGKLAFLMAKYYLWPFGKVVMSYGVQGLGESEALLQNKQAKGDFNTKILHNCGPAFVIWACLAWTVLLFANILSFTICWFLVVFIPMAKVVRVGITGILFSPDPLSIGVTSGYPGPGTNVILWTFQAINKNYYKYTVWGVNIVLLNLLPLVLAALFFSYLPKFVPEAKLPDMFMFVICLFSAIPLAYYIGLGLSSLSAQTSFSVGAVLNATFGSIIELILYVAALTSGLTSVVQASVTGSLLALMLFLPGLSMLLGGIKNSDMKFNPASAGVSGILLLLSVLGIFTPTIFYQIYGHFMLVCSECFMDDKGQQICGGCVWTKDLLENDPVYTKSAKFLQWFIACVLPISYIVGLIFTLKTHAHIVDDPAYIDMEAAQEHIPLGPKWSKLKCILVLVCSTLLFGLLAEQIVATLEPSLELLGLTHAFAGLTIIAVVSYTAEFVNAILFAIHNNFSMSLEIANSAAVQVSLIQVPVLILFSAIFLDDHDGFNMVFPILDVFTVILAVIIMNYLSIDGKANYFLGCALIVSYSLFVATYYFVPATIADIGNPIDADF